MHSLCYCLTEQCAAFCERWFSQTDVQLQTQPLLHTDHAHPEMSH